MTTLNSEHWQGVTGLLSARELEFTLSVAEGMTDKQIARQVGLAPDSVRKRIYSAMFKLGASRRPQLVAECMRRSIIAPLVMLLAVACITGSVLDSASDTERAHRTARSHRSTRGGRREDFFNNLFQV
ncbi:MAG: helix-turn-helix transcriptional regulator [Pseudomonas sp.]|nr:helix-turn-helix transcriptional regulator [Pseudomonas sp.]